MRPRVWMVLAALAQALLACDAILGSLEDRPAGADSGASREAGEPGPDATTIPDSGNDASRAGSGRADGGDASVQVGPGVGDPGWRLDMEDAAVPGFVSDAATFAGIAGSDPLYVALTDGTFFKLLPDGGFDLVRSCNDMNLANGLAVASGAPCAVTEGGELVLLSTGGCDVAPLDMYAGAWTVSRDRLFWATDHGASVDYGTLQGSSGGGAMVPSGPRSPLSHSTTETAGRGYGSEPATGSCVIAPRAAPRRTAWAVASPRSTSSLPTEESWSSSARRLGSTSPRAGRHRRPRWCQERLGWG